jgi:uncharacterized protein (DUF736 family)
MANIGSFKKTGGEYQGEIVTLSVQARGVRIIPETGRANENAPDYRVYVGRAEIGAGWKKTSAERRDYLSLKLDDPSFLQPIFAKLFDEDRPPPAPTPRAALPGGSKTHPRQIRPCAEPRAGAIPPQPAASRRNQREFMRWTMPMPAPPRRGRVPPFSIPNRPRITSASRSVR